MASQHLYAANPNERPSGWKLEGVAWFSFPSDPQPPGRTLPLYRWFRHETNDHFYTTDPAGENAPQMHYQPEDTTCWIFDPRKPQPPETVPLYRFVNHADAVHFYTINPQGEQMVDYSPEGIIGFVYPKSLQGTEAVVRWMHPDVGVWDEVKSVFKVIEDVVVGAASVLGY